MDKKEGLCFRCESRAQFLETGIGARCECQSPTTAVFSCYMYHPVKPVVLERNKSDNRPQFAGYMLSARSHYVRLADGVLKSKKYKDGTAIYWDLSVKPVPFKRIEIASTKKIDKYDAILGPFMKKIFGLKSFMVTDESSIYDFDFTLGKGKVEHNTKDVLGKIQKHYGIDVSKIKGLKLIGILAKISKSLS